MSFTFLQHTVVRTNSITDMTHIDGNTFDYVIGGMLSWLVVLCCMKCVIKAQLFIKSTTGVHGEQELMFGTWMNFLNIMFSKLQIETVTSDNCGPRWFTADSVVFFLNNKVLERIYRGRRIT